MLEFLDFLWKKTQDKSESCSLRIIEALDLTGSYLNNANSFMSFMNIGGRRHVQYQERKRKAPLETLTRLSDYVYMDY